MEILIVTQDFPPERGGIQTYALELARNFMALGARVRVICPGRASDANPLPSLADLKRLPVHSSLLFLPLLWYLPRYLRRHPSVDRVVFAQWQPALVETLPYPGRRRHKSYCLVHGRELYASVFGPAAPFMRRRVFAALDAAFPNSAEVLRLTRERAAPARPLHLVHPGVDPGAFRRADAGFLRARYGLGDAPVIVSLTRMVARKNLRGLIEALPLVRARVPGTKLLLGGTGPEREALMRLAVSSGLGETVLFPGRIADGEMNAHYSLADVFALPSLSERGDIEGFGIVFLEAGACETPVVGTLSGGIPDAIADGETGLLVPAGNRESLAEALVRLLKNKAMARDMGRRARERIENGFTWRAAAERMLGFMA